MSSPNDLGRLRPPLLLALVPAILWRRADLPSPLTSAPWRTFPLTVDRRPRLAMVAGMRQFLVYTLAICLVAVALWLVLFYLV
jgi:hypothetical protein